MADANVSSLPAGRHSLKEQLEPVLYIVFVSLNTFCISSLIQSPFLCFFTDSGDLHRFDRRKGLLFAKQPHLPWNKKPPLSLAASKCQLRGPCPLFECGVGSSTCCFCSRALPAVCCCRVF